MNVEDKEINGFLIDKFNQHGLDVGKTQGTCPLCSSTRKPENKKKKCASYDWERGIGTCHNCDTPFQLHTFKRKGKAERDYVVPATATVGNLDSKVVDWFKTRGISEQTLKQLKVSVGKEFMPQTGKQENTIQFNYLVGGNLTNIKYRDGRKNFKLYKGAEKVFYNIDSIVGHDDCVIVEGEMDVLALHEAGITNAISVPNGATLNTNNLDYLDNCIDYLVTKKADSTADWPVSMVAQRSMYKIQARTKPPTTSIAEKDTMAAKVKLGTRNWKDRSAICLYSRFKTSAVYKREGRAWP